METHLPCPCGKSSDAFSVLPSGVGYCHSGNCDKKKWPPGSFNGSTSSNEGYKQNMTSEQEEKSPKSFTPLTTVFRPLRPRGLSEKTIQTYKVDVGSEGAPYLAKYPLFSVDGRHIGNKIRFEDKKRGFPSEGDIKSQPVGLFGRHSFPAGSAKIITITEGQDDAMAVHEMSGNRYPSVSVHSASSAERDIKNDFEYLNSFEIIVFCFDNDEAGKKAALAAAGCGLPLQKIKICSLSKYKDANEYLLNRAAAEFTSEWWKATPYRPDELMFGSELWESISERKDAFSVPMPFEGLNIKRCEVRLSEAIIVTADTGVGKALAVDTPIPTPLGWTTMGELSVGDLVYDNRGLPTKVTAVTPYQLDRKCYEVLFDDGSTVIADADHNWWSIDKNSRNRGKTPYVITTQQIKDHIDRNAQANYSIPVTSIQGEEELVGVPPYTLGYWLGDGSSYSGYIWTDDVEILQYINEEGFDTEPTGAPFGYNVKGLRHLLKDSHLLGNKHIPREYMRASYSQRLALLQGLLDSDGYYREHGEFTNTNKRLSEEVYELILSLGIKAFYSEGRATLNGKDCGPKYRINFSTRIPVFRLKRKLNEVLKERPQRATVVNRYISKITEVPSVPVKCIQVDSPSHLYLFGKNFIITHNTSFIKHIEHQLLTHPAVVEKGYGVGFLHFEEPKGDTALGLLSVHNQKPYHLLSREEWDIDEVKKAYDELLNNNRVVVWDHFGSNSVEIVLNKIRHMHALGCKYIVLDHLSIVVSDQSGDERKQLDEISTKLKTLTMELDIAVIAVIHTNRQGQIRGTAGVEQLANIVIRLERDKTEANEWRRNITKVSVEKNRFAGFTGPAAYLYYNSNRATLTQLDDAEEQLYTSGGFLTDDQMW